MTDVTVGKTAEWSKICDQVVNILFELGMEYSVDRVHLERDPLTLNCRR